MDSVEPAVEMRGIGKRFGGVIALQGADFTAKQGEIHGLVGANGAGKSTLMKVLCGVHRRDTGSVHVRGKPVDFLSPLQALRSGIGLVPQEVSIVPCLSVAENIFLTEIGLRSPGRVVNWRRIFRESEALLASLKYSADVRKPAGELTLEGQHIVEIAKIIKTGTSIIVLDELGATLNAHEMKTIFGVLYSLKQKGYSVVFISHKLEEVFEIADSITVLRNGKHEGELAKGDFSRDRILTLMLGEDQGQRLRNARCEEAAPDKEDKRPRLLSLDGVSVDSSVKSAELFVRSGEIVGIAGLESSGKTELLEAIFGLRRFRGKMSVNGTSHGNTSPGASIRKGIGYLSKYRDECNLVAADSICANATSASLPKFRKHLLLSRRLERKEVGELCRNFKVKCRSVAQEVGDLSGGNRQKVTLMRWWCANSKILLLDEPTHGIDVGAKQEITGLLRTFADAGNCVLFSSSEIDDLATLCQRIYVMKSGDIVGEVRCDGNEAEAVKATVLGHMV